MKNFKLFMLAQAKEIEKYKWIESQKVGYDLGNKAVSLWIKLHAKAFRDNWNNLHDINN